MDNPRPEKVAVVEEVRERLGAAPAAILTEYRGLKVSEMAQLRRSLRAAGGDYKVYKNTLVRFAARDLGLDDLVGLLEGPTAIAFVDGDAAQVAKTLRDFSRTNPALVIKGGMLGGKVISPARTNALAELPSREVLLAQVAGAFAAPLQQFASLLSALPRNLAYGLKALADKGGANPSAAAPEAPASEVAEVEAGTAPEAAAPEAAAAEVAEVAEVEAATEPEAAEPEAAAPEASAPEEAAPEASAPEAAADQIETSEES
jgi:large subunit ribosomal protein L10